MLGSITNMTKPLFLSQVTFVEVSSNFLPDELLLLEHFVAVNSRGVESTYEWVSSDEAPEVGWMCSGEEGGRLLFLFLIIFCDLILTYAGHCQLAH